MNAQPIQPPSATEFLAMPSDPDDDEGITLPLDVDFPLDRSSTAFQLGRIADALEYPPRRVLMNSLDFGTNTIGADNQKLAELEQALQLLNEDFDDTSAKYESLFQLLADVEKLVSKSTSKLALSVRDAITAWKTGTVEPTYADPEPGSAADLDTPALEQTPDVTEDNPRRAPDHDAPVEVWRVYAASFGLAEGINLEQMNRSQIRSMLGISQTA